MNIHSFAGKRNSYNQPSLKRGFETDLIAAANAFLTQQTQAAQQEITEAATELVSPVVQQVQEYLPQPITEPVLTSAAPSQYNLIIAQNVDNAQAQRLYNVFFSPMLPISSNDSEIEKALASVNLTQWYGKSGKFFDAGIDNSGYFGAYVDDVGLHFIWKNKSQIQKASMAIRMFQRFINTLEAGQTNLDVLGEWGSITESYYQKYGGDSFWTNRHIVCSLNNLSDAPVVPIIPGEPLPPVPNPGQVTENKKNMLPILLLLAAGGI